MTIFTPETRREMRTIIGLAWPIMLTTLNWTLMHLIDVAVVGRIGTDQLGALAAGRSITFITIVVGIATMSGILVFAARADGAGDRRATGAIWRQGMILGAVLGMGLCVFLLMLADRLIALIGIGPELADGGADVVRAMALAYPAQFLSMASAFFLEGISRPRRVMAINLAVLPVNAVLAWAMAGGHLGLPAMGAVGAVLATAVASWLAMGAMVMSVRRLDDAVARGIRDGGWRNAVARVPALLRFGAMPALASGFEIAGFSWLIVLSTRLGPVPASAFQTVFSLHNFAFALSLGLGSAAGVRAGNAMGEGKPMAAVTRGRLAVVMALVLTGTFALAMFLFPAKLIGPFSNDPAVIALSIAMLVGLAPFMAFDAMQVVLVNVMRSMGDQVMAGINSIIGFFLVTGIGGWWLVQQGVGPMALIWASGAGMVTVMVLQAGRLIQLMGRLRRQNAWSPT